MKNLFCMQFLFLVSVVSIDCSFSSLSPVILITEKNIRNAVDILSPVGNETVAQAHRTLQDVYEESPYKHVYINENQAKKEKQRLKEAYLLLEKCGFGNSTKQEIEVALKIDDACSDILTRSFSSSFGFTNSEFEEDRLQQHEASSVTQDVGSNIVHSKPQQVSIHFKNKQEAFGCLGLPSSASWDQIEHRVALFELDNALGTVSDEKLDRAKSAGEYLKLVISNKI